MITAIVTIAQKTDNGIKKVERKMVYHQEQF